MRQIILDTETTGLEPKQGHRIIEIGCVELINRRITDNNFHCYTTYSNLDKANPSDLKTDGLRQLPRLITVSICQYP